MQIELFDSQQQAEAYGGALEGVRCLLHLLGIPHNDEGTQDTPRRVIKSFIERCEGYNQKPEDILSVTFTDDFDEMVILRDIDFYSTCEHHLLPFAGRASVGYIPNPDFGVVGLSKLARLVDCYAHRLQLQERLTSQIVKALETYLNPVGAGVIIEAAHQCMGCRGVKKPNARMITSKLSGVIFDKPEARAEFFRLAGY